MSFVPEDLLLDTNYMLALTLSMGMESLGSWAGEGLGEEIAEMERKVHNQPAFVCDNACAVERERPFDNNF